jgi:hypothetical protein
MQVATTVRDVGDALTASLAGALTTFMSAIPRIIGFLLVLVIGWFIASLIAKAVAALLHSIKFNDLARRSGLADFVHNMGVKTDSAGVIASSSGMDHSQPPPKPPLDRLPPNCSSARRIVHGL